jgi:hypothetical protein
MPATKGRAGGVSIVRPLPMGEEEAVGTGGGMPLGFQARRIPTGTRLGPWTSGARGGGVMIPSHRSPKAACVQATPEDTGGPLGRRTA